MKRTFEIEFPDDCGPLWMNRDNLMLCLTTQNHCSNVRLVVQDVSGLDDCDPSPVIFDSGHLDVVVKPLKNKSLKNKPRIISNANRFSGFLKNCKDWGNENVG